MTVPGAKFLYSQGRGSKKKFQWDLGHLCSMIIAGIVVQENIQPRSSQRPVRSGEAI